MRKSEKCAVLLTGNTGYIGTIMTRFLRERAYYVMGLDNDWFKDNCFFAVSENSKPDKQIIKDTRDIAREDLDGVGAVIHLAALSNDPLGELNPSLTDEINHISAVKIAKLCKENGIERFIFASSCSIYGKSGGEAPINEGGALNPITAYAKAKVDAEASLADLANSNFHPVFMRNATVYGLSPKLRLDLVVNNLLAWAYLTGEITIMSDGTPWRPIVHIEDFCAAFIAALEAPADKVSCQAFNVGQNEENYQVKDIAAAIREFLPEAKIKILNQTGPDERTYKVDFSKIKNNLDNFKPRWNLRKGIAELLEAYKKHNLTAGDFNSGRYFRLKALKSLIESGKV